MFLGGMRADDKPINAHTELGQYGIPYYAYPPPNSDDVLRYSAKCDQTRALTRGDRNVVFVGQVPRLLPLPYVPWALDLLVEDYAIAWVLQTQQNGCAKAWTETDVQVDELVKRSKKLLFDVCGVWVARSEEQRHRIDHYQSTMQMRGPLDGRVPRHGIIIERLRPPQSATMRQQDAPPAVAGALPAAPATGPMRTAMPSASAGANVHAVPYQPSVATTIQFAAAPPQYTTIARSPMQQGPPQQGPALVYQSSMPAQQPQPQVLRAAFATPIPVAVGRPFGQTVGAPQPPFGQPAHYTPVEAPSYLRPAEPAVPPAPVEPWGEHFKFGLFDAERTFNTQQ